MGLRNWRNIPKPDFWKVDNAQEETTAELATFETAFQTFRCSYKLVFPVEDSTYTGVQELIATVWGEPIKTLFVSRNDLEVTRIMRRTVENAQMSINQVQNMDVEYPYCLVVPLYYTCHV